MDVSSVLKEDWISRDLKARTPGEALRKVVSILPEYLRKQAKEDIITKEMDQEEVSPTRFAVDRGVAFPHVRTNRVEGIQAALGLFPDGVSFGNSGKQPVRFVVLFLIENQRSGLYLKLLSSFSTILSSSVHRQNILEAQSASAILAYLSATGEQLVGEVSLHDLVVPVEHSLRPDSPIEEAVEELAEQTARPLPVVSENGEVLGTVGHRELMSGGLQNYLMNITAGSGEELPRVLASYLKMNGDQPVEGIMDTDPFLLEDSESIFDATSRLVEKNRSEAFVVSDGKLVGRFTLASLTRRVLGPGVV